MEQKHRTVFMSAAIVMLVVLTILTGFLTREYIFFIQQMEELVLVKEEYNSNVLALRRAILDYEAAHDTELVDDRTRLEKKKRVLGSAHSEESFLVVNREPKYLHASARELARKHNIEYAIDRLYTSHCQLSAHQPVVKKRLGKRCKMSSRDRFKRVAQRQCAAYIPNEQLQDVVLQWPIARNYFRISSGFGPRRHPRGYTEFHAAIDMAAPGGTPVFAATAGVVEQARHSDKGYGNVVMIRHTSKVKTRYAHLSKITIAEGAFVEQGQMIGKVGKSGNVRGKNGEHLHFEVWVGPQRVNPRYFLP